MRKTTIKTCFCFLDFAVAFIKNGSLLSVSKFGSKCFTIRKKKEIFILSERETFSFNNLSGEMTAHRVIVSCCVKCRKFQTLLKISVWHSLDNVKCKNTADDDFTFTEEEIFMGCYPNDFDEQEWKRV